MAAHLLEIAPASSNLEHATRATLADAIMDERLYKLGMAGLRWLTSFEPVARPLEGVARVWQRHRKLYGHLRAQGFDGVIDVGATRGEFAQIVRAALPEADLVCVEPNKQCAATLRAGGYR